jgi:hypothetical protein
MNLPELHIRKMNATLETWDIDDDHLCDPCDAHV